MDRMPIRTTDFFRLRLKALWEFMRSQPASFWLLNVYLFLEYVRPQSIWPFLAFFPWTQASILLTLAAVVLERQSIRFQTSAGPLLFGFAAVLVLSSLMAYQPALSYAKWEVFFSWVLIYILITNVITTERRFLVMMLGFLLYSFKMSQHGFRTWALNGFGFSDWGVTGGPGWFHNSGEFGIQMCVFLPLSVEFILALRQHWSRVVRWFFYLMPITAVGGMIASSSRGALVGLAALALWWILRSKHRVRSIVAVLVVGMGVWSVVPAEQKARFETAGEDGTSTHRLEMWEDGIEIANQYPVLGIGYNNWHAYYMTYYTQGLPHNIFIEAWAELGYLGLLSFLSLICVTFALNHKTRRLLKRVPSETPFMTRMAYGLDGALIGYIASGFFVTVLYYPYFWINLAMTVALHTAARRARRRRVGFNARTVSPAALERPVRV